ncbi:3-deoxy-7-phosphoheptulonate synthase [Streptomyces halstedii]|uniref:3-deoxy-7-phosphoheptulonate synthase n=1 Tax=Streptomyces TaxID=1883 RepID=UPI0004AF003B|nr:MULTISPECIES: 3-deoxy-7-phosphoheptulonate synthase [Streptomyces]MYR72804.1 phospho-2-dehydro-3-deoxyheptonate aldolase [Streptomyces sp. SID4925]MYY19714.1 phospho-2-dehydro-3-deoxyheptonate aldolase [Streptomyces sp. SID4912]SBU95394.1 3-deoxy-D-arabinoheptulosonate-7-phosphate synthase [Streptomyces sp. OspMP-M45]SCD68925.1 3-deoxy-D-arabinoheptulosonate-7-phosphate synthase [Streptomyces sp. DpondAA-D4]
MPDNTALLLAEDEGAALSLAELRRWRALPARQQPDWLDHPELDPTRELLAARPALVTGDEVATLRLLLAEVAQGRCQVVQAGDCAEDPAECAAGPVSRKADLLDRLATVMSSRSGVPVLRVGRIAGQFAKPRSRPTEHVGERELPVYRGHMVNAPAPDARARRPAPSRMTVCYDAAATAVDTLRLRRTGDPAAPDSRVWTSHEALVLDYELPLTRRDHAGRLLLTSTHWPWIGERTRQADGAHVRLLAAVDNPVACKVGPSAAVDDLLRLCGLLDPGRTPGRLTLIARMGAEAVTARLPALVSAVRAAGHPVSWLSDPMHGNTVSAPGGLKTRRVDTIVAEVVRFQEAVSAAGGVAGGLHLETTPHAVTECVADASGQDRLDGAYTTLCDPRLNPWQAHTVVSAWRGQDR